MICIEKLLFGLFSSTEKKADAVKHAEVLNRVGLRFIKPPAVGGLPFISSSDVLGVDPASCGAVSNRLQGHRSSSPRQRQGNHRGFRGP
jgi:hypothetical protein